MEDFRLNNSETFRKLQALQSKGLHTFESIKIGKNKSPKGIPNRPYGYHLLPNSKDEIYIIEEGSLITERILYECFASSDYCKMLTENKLLKKLGINNEISPIDFFIKHINGNIEHQDFVYVFPEKILMEDLVTGKLFEFDSEKSYVCDYILLGWANVSFEPIYLNNGNIDFIKISGNLNDNEYIMNVLNESIDFIFEFFSPITDRITIYKIKSETFYKLWNK